MSSTLCCVQVAKRESAVAEREEVTKSMEARVAVLAAQLAEVGGMFRVMSLFLWLPSSHWFGQGHHAANCRMWSQIGLVCAPFFLEPPAGSSSIT